MPSASEEKKEEAASSTTNATASSHWARDSVEEDRVETLIRRTGCWDLHVGVVECMGDARDWRVCQEQVSAFRECMQKGTKPVATPKDAKK